MATVITNAGLAIITDRIVGAGSEPRWVAIGTGAGTAAVGDTTLFNEVESRVSGTSSRQETAVPNDTHQVIGTVEATAAREVTNAGLFDAATGGNLYMKGNFAPINLGPGDSISLTARVQYENA
jgi:hypothetical protein